MASFRINSIEANGNSGSNDLWLVNGVFYGNGSKAVNATITFASAFNATTAQRDSAAGTAIIAAGAALSPAFTVLAADIGPK